VSRVEAGSELARVAIRLGLGDLIHSPRTAELIKQIGAEAAACGQTLERFQLHREGVTDEGSVCVYWVVGNLPDHLPLRTFPEADALLSEQISVRLQGEWENAQDDPQVLCELRMLLRQVKEANDRDGVESTNPSYGTESDCPSWRFVFPVPPRPCNVKLLGRSGWRRKSSDIANAVERAEALALRIGCELVQFVVAPEGACKEEEHGVFWAMLPKGHLIFSYDTDSVQASIHSITRVESRLLADDPTTIAVLNELWEKAERTLTKKVL
jgi:hypothetical protein